jgi:hypothetical protein
MMKLEITQNEKELGRKVGKIYIGLAKAMGLFLLLSLVMTAVTVYDADPYGTQFSLDAGKSASLGTFYAENGEKVQIAFGLEQASGQYYNYPEYTQGQEYRYYDDYYNQNWVVNAIVLKSDSLSFERSEKVADVSGEALTHEMTLETGFYKVIITNLSDQSIVVWAGYASANLGLLVGTALLWAGFGVTVGLFTALVQIGFWLVVFYLVAKLIMAYQENERQKMKAYYEQMMVQQAQTEVA